MASADWSTVDFGAAQGDEAVVLDMAKTLAQTGANMTVTIEQGDTYSFRLDAINPGAPVLTVSQKRPFGTNTVLLRGEMNGWDESTPFTYLGNGLYSVAQSLTAGTYQFKAATGDWSTVNLGGVEGGDTEVTVGNSLWIEHGGNPPNLSATIEADGDFDFVIDGQFTARPTLFVFVANDWDNDGTVNAEDSDIDGDGVENALDAFPINKLESVDSDGDGIGDNSDVFPADAGEWFDDNGNGVGDNADAAAEEEGGEEEVVVGFGSTTVLLRGDMNGWDASTPFINKGMGRYAVEVELTAGTYGFKLASEDWATVNLGAASADDTAVMLGEAKLLLAGSNDNLSIEIAEDGAYVFMLDASDASMPMLTVRTEVPYMDTAVFLRGDMNGWSEDDQFVYTGDGKYAVTVDLTMGSYGFKFASADWSTVNMGAPSADDTAVMLNEPKQLLSGSNDNLGIDIAEDGSYVFTVDATFPDMPVLTVSTPVPYGSTTIYLRGAMNGWGTADAFAYDGDGVYSQVVYLAAGDYEFKVADADWATVNYGSDDGAMMLDTPKTLSYNAGNLSLSVDTASDYRFSVDASDPNAPVLTISAEASPFGDATLLLRGDMNGWDESTAFSYSGEGIYMVPASLNAGSYGFKVATADWSTVNIGGVDGGDVDLMVGSSVWVENGSNPPNLSLTVDADGDYDVVLDANFLARPKLFAFKANDWDGDDIVNSEDGDIDGDGVGNDDDAFPFDSSESMDSDGDGVGDNADVFPDDPTEWFDDDGNGTGDNADAEAEQGGNEGGEAGPMVGFGDTVVLLRGDMNGWGASTAFEDKGEGRYFVEYELAVGTYGFKIASEDWSTVDLGAGDTDQVYVDTPVDLVAAGGNLTLNIDTEGTYAFMLDASDASMPVLTVRPELPYGDTAVLLRGDMNGWGEDDALMYEGAGIYSVAVDLTAGTYGFKLASSDWSTVNLGATASDQATVTLGAALDLLPGSNDNLSVEITSDGSYVFTLDASFPDMPVLTVSTAVPYGAAEVFLRGDMNGWGTADAFAYDGNGMYSVTVFLEPGDYQFKFADADWGAVNYGADDGAMTLDMAKTLAHNAGNLSLTVEMASDYRFTIDASTADAPVLTISDAAPYAGSTVLLRGDMNGWDESTALTYMGEGIYAVAVELAAGDYGFKLASADWSTVNLGAAAADATAVTIDEALALAQDSQDNLGITIEDATSYLFVLDASDVSSPFLSVHYEEVFYGSTALLRGDMNGWDESTAFNYDGSGMYSVTVNLTAGTYGFKVASSDWATINLGAASAADATVELGVAEALVQDSQDNFSLTVDADGDYDFVIMPGDYETPELTVTASAP